MDKVFSKRFLELEQAFAVLPLRPAATGSSKYVPSGDWKQWATSAQSLVRAVFGVEDPHYVNFVEAYRKCNGYDYEVQGIGGVFKSAKDDFEGGYVFNVNLRISGEVFGDFVVLARHALAEGHKDVAAVLAAAALEDALKRFAAAKGLQVDGKTMSDVVNALKASGLVSGAQKTLLDAMPRVRNHALHAEWEKISESDVGSIVGFVEQFLLANFA